MKKYMQWLLAAMIVLTMAGCSNGSKGKAAEQTELTVWHTFTEVHEKTLAAMVDEYNQSQTQVHVTALAQPLEGFDSKVYEAVSNGTGPDMVLLPASNAADYVNEGLAINFADYMDETAYKNRVPAGIYEESIGFPDKGLHCLAIQSTGPVFFYNKTIYDELGLTAPKTWTEVESNSKKIYEAKGIPGFAADSISDISIMALEQQGIDFIKKDGTVDWNQPKMVEWMNWFQKGVEAGYFQLSPTTGDYNSSDIGAHMLGAYIGSSAGLPFVNLGEHTLAVSPIPQFENGTPWVQSWTRNLIGFKKSETHDKAVTEFAQFFTTAENTARWAIAFGGFSPYTDAGNSADYNSYVAGNIALQALQAQNSYAAALPVMTGASTARTELEKAVKKTATRQADAVTALQEAITVSNQALSE